MTKDGLLCFVRGRGANHQAHSAHPPTRLFSDLPPPTSHLPPRPRPSPLAGSPAILLGAATWFYLPTYPDRAKWLTERERELIHNRVARQRSLVRAIDRTQLLRTIRSVKIWAFCIMEFAASTCVGPGGPEGGPG